MFKPTLKRSKMPPKSVKSISPFYKIQPQHIQRAMTSHDPVKSLIIPSTFLNNNFQLKPPSRNSQTRILSPLYSHNLPYPQQVQQQINVQINQSDQWENRGCQFGIFWYHGNQCIFLWNYKVTNHGYEVKKQQKYSFASKIIRVAIGSIQLNGSQIDHKRFQLALGFDHILDIYRIDAVNLEIKHTQISFKIDQSIQKMIFTQNKELLVICDEGSLTRVSFCSTKIKNWNHTHQGINKTTAKPTQLQYSVNKFFNHPTTLSTQKIVSAPHSSKIYLLIKYKKTPSTLSTNLSILKRLFSAFIPTNHQSTVKKFINVYNIRHDQTLVYEGKIQQETIISALYQNYSKVRQEFQFILNYINHKPSESCICSINIPQKQKPEQLAITFITGHVATIRINRHKIMEDLGFDFVDMPDKLPSCLAHQYDDVSLIKNIQLKHLVVDNSILLGESNGYYGINFLSNNYCYYIDHENIQYIKYKTLPHLVIEFQYNDDCDRAWAMFNKDKITIVRLLKIWEIVLIYTDCQIHEATSRLSLIQTKVQIQGSDDCDVKMHFQRYGVCYDEGSQNQVLDDPNNSSQKEELKTNKKIISQQQKMYHIFMPLQQIIQQLSNIIGNNRLCESIVTSLIYVVSQNSKFNPGLCNYLNPGKQNHYLISQNLRNAAEQQLKPLQYTININDHEITRFQQKNWNHILFQHNNYYDIRVNKQIQESLWALLTGVQNLKQYNQRNNENNFGSYELCLTRKVSQVVGKIRGWQVSDFVAKSAMRRKLIGKLQVLSSFFEKKKSKSLDVFRNLGYFRKRIKSLITIKQKAVLFQLQSFSGKNIMEAWLKGNIDLVQSIRQLQNTILIFIPKMLASIQLYSLLGEKKRKYNLPTLQKFLTSLPSRKRIKQELLQTFSQKISSNFIVNKFNIMLPQLGLQTDLLFEKWMVDNLSFEAEGERMTDFRKKIRIQQINCEKIALTFGYNQILKVRHILKNWPPTYIKLLACRYQQVLIEKDAIKKIVNHSIFPNAFSASEKDLPQLDQQLINQFQIQAGFLKTKLFHEIQDIISNAYNQRGDQQFAAKCYFNEVINMLEGYPNLELFEYAYQFMKKNNYFIQQTNSMKNFLESRKGNQRNLYQQIALKFSLPTHHPLI